MVRAITLPLPRRLLLLVVVALLPLTALSIAGVVLLARQKTSEIERATIETMRAMVSAVDGELQNVVEVAQAMALSPVLAAGDYASFYRMAKDVCDRHESWVTVALARPSGEQEFNTRRPYGQKLPPHTDRDSVQHVVDNREPAIGNLSTSAITGKQEFSIRVPVLKDGAVAHVLSVTVNPEALLKVIERQRVPPDGVVSIFDASGRHVARSRGHGEYLGQPGSATLQRLMLGHNEGWGRTLALEGQPLYSAFSRSLSSHWSVAVGLPADEVDAGIAHSYLVLGVGVGLSMLLGALASALLARGITRPMAELRAAAHAVGRHEVPPLPTGGIPEVLEVGAALRSAAAARLAAEAEREGLLRRERSARASAEAANHAKDEFLAMLGHELRNPLSAIANAAHVLEREPTSDESGRRARQVIQRQVEHFARVLDDLLDVARVATGKIVLARTTLDLAVAVEDALATLRAGGKLDRHRVTVDLTPAWIDADPARIEQIVTNLVGNAVKYTPPGKTISLSTKTADTEAVLTVADEGIGIDTELLPRIFDPFVQNERELDRAQGGLGIGLTLVRRLTELHGGRVEARSDGADRGSTFLVRLPAIAAPLPAQPVPKSTAAAGCRDVLIVEDNDDSREMLQCLLEYDGHRVRSARDGRQGVDSALDEPPEVAIVDIGLPGIDGFEVARRIRAAEHGAEVLLVALTGYGAEEDRHRAREAGFDLHLVKPVNRASLARVMAMRVAHVDPPEPG